VSPSAAEQAASSRRRRRRRLFYAAAAGVVAANGYCLKAALYVPQELFQFLLSVSQSLAQTTTHAIFDVINDPSEHAVEGTAIAAAAISSLYAVNRLRKRMGLPVGLRRTWRSIKWTAALTAVAAVSAFVFAWRYGRIDDVILIGQDVADRAASAVSFAYRHHEEAGAVIRSVIGAAGASMTFYISDCAISAGQTLAKFVGGPITTPWKKNSLHVTAALVAGAVFGLTGTPYPSIPLFVWPIIGIGALAFCRDQAAFLLGVGRITSGLAKRTTTFTVATASTATRTVSSIVRISAGGAAFVRAHPRTSLAIGTALLTASMAAVSLIPGITTIAGAAFTGAWTAAMVVSAFCKGAWPTAMTFTAVAAIRGYTGPTIAAVLNAGNHISQCLLFGARILPEPVPVSGHVPATRIPLRAENGAFCPDGVLISNGPMVRA
jgi:hypothetical protein